MKRTERTALYFVPFLLMFAATAEAAMIGQDGHSDRVIVSDANGTARWAVDASTATSFGDGVEDAAILFGATSDIHLLGDVDGDGLVDKIRVSDEGGTWRWGWDLSTATTFGDGAEDGAVLYGGGALMTPHAVTDVNGDGNDDLVLVDDSPGFHQYMVDFNLDGTFDNEAGFGAAAPTHLLVGMTDINGDGLSDRVIDLDGINGGFTWHYDLSVGAAPNGTLGDGNLDGGALYGGTGMVPLLGDLNNDDLGDRVVVIDPLTNPTWLGDFSSGGIFGDGTPDFFELATFGVAGDQFLLGDVITTIPEPATLALFVLGGLAICGMTRKQHD